MNGQSKIKFEEFKSAFKDARYRALSHFLDTPDYDEYNSLAMIQLLPIQKQELLLKNVYERSFQLGLDISQRYKQISFKEEIVHLLAYTGIPCVSGNWKNPDNTLPLILSHKKCPEVDEMTDYSPNIIKCSYWHQSIKGILDGINQEIKFSGTKVLENNKEICVNFIQDSSFSSEIWESLPLYLHDFLLKLKKIYSFFGINFKLRFYFGDNVYYSLGKPNTFAELINYHIAVNFFIKFSLLKMPDIQLFEI